MSIESLGGVRLDVTQQTERFIEALRGETHTPGVVRTDRFSSAGLGCREIGTTPNARASRLEGSEQRREGRTSLLVASFRIGRRIRLRGRRID